MIRPTLPPRRALLIGASILLTVVSISTWKVRTRDVPSASSPSALPHVVATSTVSASSAAADSWAERIAKAGVRDFRAMIAEALLIDDSAVREKVLTRLITAWLNLDSKDFSKYFAALEVSAPNDDTNLRLVLSALKHALTQLTPDAAKSDATMALIERFVTNLAKYNPEEAHRWAKQWLLDDTLDASLVTVAREFAKRSPALGKGIIAEIKGPLRRMQAQTAVGGIWAATEPAAAVEWARNLPQPTERAITMNAVLLAVAQTDPSLAATRLRETEQQLATEYEAQRRRDLAANNLTEADLANDPDLYKEMLAAGSITPPRSPDIELLADAGRVIATKLAETDASASASWAESIQHDYLKTKTVAGVASGIAKTDPARAVALANRYNTIDDVLTSAFDSWASVSAEAAARGISLVTDPAKRMLALDTVIERWVADGDPVGAAHFLDELPASERSDAAEARVIAAMSHTDPETAWTRAQTISDPRLRYRAMKNAFAVLATERPEAARNLLASTTMAARDAERLREMLIAVGAER